VNDIIVSVNGVQGEWGAMLKEFDADVVTVVVERPSERLPFDGARWTVRLLKGMNEKLGANLFAASECRDKTVLAVASVNPVGLLQDYNTRNPTRAVEEHDLIVKVNGREGDPNAMLDQILHKPDVTLLIERPSLAEVQQWTATNFD
jgi:hypothetical protein